MRIALYLGFGLLLAGCEAAMVASNVYPAVSAAVASARQPSATRPAAASPVPAHCPPSGTEIVTSDGRTIRHLGRGNADRELCGEVRSGVPGVVPMLHGFVPATWDGTGEVRAGLRPLFPLQTGRVASFTVTRTDGIWRLTYRVTGDMQLTVPAGTYGVWVVEYVEEGNFGAFRGERVLYVDKATGAIVKATSVVVRGAAARVGYENFEAVSVSLAR